MYTGWGAQWHQREDQNGEHYEQALSVGPKAGYRIPLARGADLEPYVAFGVRFIPGIDFASYLGFKIALFPMD